MPTLRSINNLARIAYAALLDTIRHDGIEHAGYLAFIFLLSLFPFLVFFFALVGGMGQSDLGLTLVNMILDNDVIPADLLAALQPRIQEIVSGPPQGLLTVAIIGAIWTSSSSVEGLRTILNRAYRVSTPPAYILRRLLSIGQFLILTGAIVMVTSILIILPTIWDMIAQLIDPVILKKIRSIFGIETKVDTMISLAWNYIRYAFTFLTLFAVVSITYYSVPNLKQKWNAVTPGACIVVILWFVTGFVLSAYLSHFNQLNVIYGSLGGIIVSLLFFYLAATIFIYGAEFNYRLERYLGHVMVQKVVVAEHNKVVSE